MGASRPELTTSSEIVIFKTEVVLGHKPQLGNTGSHNIINKSILIKLLWGIIFKIVAVKSTFCDLRLCQLGLPLSNTFDLRGLIIHINLLLFSIYLISTELFYALQLKIGLECVDIIMP